MLILGLGTNLGDRMQNLRSAYQHLKMLPDFSIQQVSPIYVSDALLPKNASPDWDTPYLNLALRCETTLDPYKLLKQLKYIEQLVGRAPDKDWGPRIIDIDILAWDNLVQYDEKLHIPHEHLHERPFALFPLADVAPFWIYPLPGSLHGKTASELAAQFGSRFNGDAPFHTRQIQQRIDTPQWVGIINITPDSFSDGTETTSPETFVEQALQLVAAGAEVLDIGAEATNPRAMAISWEEEWRRLEPSLNMIISETRNTIIKPKLSIDTRHAEIANRVLKLGVDWINDVTGLDDPLMRETMTYTECDVIVMHHLAVPTIGQRILPLDQDPVVLVYEWAEKRINELVKHGIASDRIIFDVGIGFGKNAEQSLWLIKHIEAFKRLNVRLLVGHSRKTFLGQFTEMPFAERDIETVALSTYLALQNVTYLRIHNVDLHARAFKALRSVSTSM